MRSPTQHTLALLQREWYTTAVCEHWNAHAWRRVDLSVRSTC
jgi:hypothetical protein